MTARTRGILAGDGQDREWPHLAPRRQAPRIEVDPYRSTMIRHVIAGGGMCLRRAGGYEAARAARMVAPNGDVDGAVLVPRAAVATTSKIHA